MWGLGPKQNPPAPSWRSPRRVTLPQPHRRGAPLQAQLDDESRKRSALELRVAEGELLRADREMVPWTRPPSLL